MNYRTAGYSFSHSPNALALNGLQPFREISSPKVTPLSFSAMPAQQVFDDQSEAPITALSGGALGLAKNVSDAFGQERQLQAEFAKEERKHLRDLQLEKIKSDRTANYRKLQEDYLRSRTEKTNKDMNDRLDSVGVPKSRRTITVDPSVIQGRPPEGFDPMQNAVREQGDGENEEESDAYMDLSRDVSDLPEVKPDLPVADEPLPDLVAPDGQETSMLQGLKAPIFKMDDFEVSYQPGSLTAQAGSVPSPATVALSDQLKSLDLSGVPVSVNFVSPAQEQALYDVGVGVRDIVNDADVQQKAQELFDLKAMKSAGEQAAAPTAEQAAVSPEAPPPGGYFWDYKDAWKAHSVQLPGYKKPQIKRHTTDDGFPFYEVLPPEPIEETAEERMAKQQGKEGEGGKTLLAEQTKILANISEVAAALDSIEPELNAVENRGPIMGLIRGANPYDVVAQRIEALVNGLVPKVARGVFGEVGVLTDQDIAHYKKILPSMKSQPELATVLLADLRRKLDQTRIANLDVFQKAGYDVSSFNQASAPTVDIQRQISETYNQLMKAPKNSPEYQSLYAKLRDLRREQRKMQRIATP
jgi:hypothetical protein